MSIKQTLTKAWEECKKEGVELSTVDFTILRGISGESSPCDVEYSGRAIEKPQSSTAYEEVQDELRRRGSSLLE